MATTTPQPLNSVNGQVQPPPAPRPRITAGAGVHYMTSGTRPPAPTPTQPAVAPAQPAVAPPPPAAQPAVGPVPNTGVQTFGGPMLQQQAQPAQQPSVQPQAPPGRGDMSFAEWQRTPAGIAAMNERNGVGLTPEQLAQRRAAIEAAPAQELHQQAQTTGATGPVPGATVNPITQQNTTAWSSVTPQQTPQEAQLQQYQMQLAGQAATTPTYDYSGIGQAQTQQGTQATSQALGMLGSLPGYGNYSPITNGRTDNYSTQAAGMLGGVGSVAGPSAESTALRQALMGAQGALNGPDRSALAKSNFDLLQQAYEPTFQTDLRNVGKKAAALGRIGAGMSTSDLGDVVQRKNEYFGRAGQQLANDAAAQSLQDRLQILGGTQGAMGAVDSTDLARGGQSLQAQGLGLNAANSLFGQGQALRGEEMANRQFDFGKDAARNQLGLQTAGAMGSLGGQAFGMGANMRGEQFGYDNARFSSGLQGLDAVAGLGNMMYGQNAGLRGELRGERANQQAMDQQAQDNMTQQILLEQSLLGGQAGINNNAFNSLYNAGYGGAVNPTGQMNYQGQVDQGQANEGFGGAADVLSQYFAGQVGNQGAPMQPGTASSILGNPMTPKVIDPKPLKPAPTTFPTKKVG